MLLSDVEDIRNLEVVVEAEPLAARLNDERPARRHSPSVLHIAVHWAAWHGTC